MDIEMIRKAKVDLEKSISEQIDQFSKKTNVIVTDIKLYRIERQNFADLIQEIIYTAEVKAEV